MLKMGRLLLFCFSRIRWRDMVPKAEKAAVCKWRVLVFYVHNLAIKILVKHSSQAQCSNHPIIPRLQTFAVRRNTPCVLYYTPFAICFYTYIGAAGSALLTFEGSVGGADIFRQLLYWRILLGVGAGGVSRGHA